MKVTEMTARQLVAYYSDFLAVREHVAANSEHVTIVGDGEDFHSSDSARALLEVGYWGTLDVGAVS